MMNYDMMVEGYSVEVKKKNGQEESMKIRLQSYKEKEIKAIKA